MKTFWLRFLGAVLALVAAANLAVAADIPMRIDWAMNGSSYTNTFAFGGVCSDDNGYPILTSCGRNATYVNGVDLLQVYLGVGGKNVVLFTYNTTTPPRGLFFDSTKLPAEEKARWAGAGLPLEPFFAQVVSYFQTKVRYQNIKPGSAVAATGQVEFRYNGDTYTLRYTDLAVKNIGTNRWLITSDPTDPGVPSTTWMRAILSILRNGGHVVYGWVGMPIRLEATFK